MIGRDCWRRFRGGIWRGIRLEHVHFLGDGRVGWAGFSEVFLAFCSCEWLCETEGTLSCSALLGSIEVGRVDRYPGRVGRV